MDDIFSDAERAMAALCEPLGDYAPRRRRRIADYKDSAGRDLHQDLVTWHDRQAADEALVRSIREALAGNGCRLTALAECMEDGTGRALYLAPGYLEEFAAEMGLTMPENIAAALAAAGVHPVNWEELTYGAKSQRKGRAAEKQ
ncbi:hypothetical protein D1159_12265 [Pseudoflavonifractor sp. 524-17]|uniref:HET domain-containing protein n=1 Tax=Pseudoflavonifractor sp. 524-17 TaxID=2304577 RepID=UPI00137ACBDC|nr:HET domain-containing protein [Pseudoflavonifractor sp. 524-17]NCE65330.1 hypothetical protein [Pseudoflavonifractor sp. 524-17]